MFILGGFDGGVQPRLEPADSDSVLVLTTLSAVYRSGLHVLYAWWHNSSGVIAPPMFISPLFALSMTGRICIQRYLPSWAQRLPLAEQGLAVNRGDGGRAII